MIQEEQAKGDKTYSRLPRMVLKKLDLMEKLRVPETEIRQTEEAYRRLPEIRRRMLQRLLAEKRNVQAEALLRESKALDSRCPGLVSRYSKALIARYEETGQKDRLLEELQFQVFRCIQRDLTYVKKLKESAAPDQWPDLRERLLSGRTLYGGLQEALLELEGLYSRLMRRMGEEESLTALDRWEAVLRPRFPEQVQKAYARRRRMEKAGIFREIQSGGRCSAGLAHPDAPPVSK